MDFSDKNEEAGVFKVLQCFKGPVHKAFVYAYYQIYIQETDMYSYSMSNGLNKYFTVKELNVLENERRPTYLSLSLLYKVLKICCAPSLAHYEDPAWECTEEERPSPDSSVENVISTLMNSYNLFLMKADCLTSQNCLDIINNLSDDVSLLIQKCSCHSNTSRWMDEREKLLNYFTEIKKCNFSSGFKSLMDLVEMEIQFRADLCEVILKKELNDFEERTLDLQEFRCSDYKESSENTEKCIEVGTLLQFMQDQKKKICWIAGEHGVGKSTLAAFYVTSWMNKNYKTLRLKNYRFVVSISVSEISVTSAKTFMKLVFPLSSFFVDVDSILKDFLKEFEGLIIIDDINNLGEESLYKLYHFIIDIPNVTVILLGRMLSFSKYANIECFKMHSMFIKLNGLKKEKILELSEEWTKETTSALSLKEKLKENMNRLGHILKYPFVLYLTCELWKSSNGSILKVFTASELMWELMAWKAKMYLKININHKGPMKKKFCQWLMLVGDLSLCSLRLDLNLNKASLEELNIETNFLFPEHSKSFLHSLFPRSITLTTLTCRGIPSSSSKPFLEYFSSWFLVEQLLAEKRLKDLIKGFTDPLPLVLLAAGHLERLQEEGSINVVEERRLIKALVNYREDSFDDFAFIQEFVAELKCTKRLVEIVIDETEYNEEWNLDVAKVQQKSLEVLLNHVSPTRLIFLADESEKNYELSSVMSYVCRVNISVWLDSIPQFTYGNRQKLDKLLKPFLEERVVPKLDLISGCISSSLMKELSNSTATQHLVLLKLKVSNLKSLNMALSLPAQLSKLLWLELKLDMELPEHSLVVATKVALLDIHFKGLDALNVTKFTDLLVAMHMRYTGIHLEDTSLTPENVFGFLKELSKRGVALKAEEESINKFRRWYYPSLNAISAVSRLTEEEYVDLIGHDDRKFYSDHYVSSSQFITALDAWNLRNYLENQRNIVYFKYEASNIIFCKKLDGEVEISFKGDYKEVVEENVISKNPTESCSKVIDMY